MKTQKGITLIALIITIIVMMILVGVSVTAVLNSGLFKAAQGAAKNTMKERQNEIGLSAGNIIIGDKQYGTLEDYINSLQKSKIIIAFMKGEEEYDYYEVNIPNEPITWANYLEEINEQITSYGLCISPYGDLRSTGNDTHILHGINGTPKSVEPNSYIIGGGMYEVSC